MLPRRKPDDTILELQKVEKAFAHPTGTSQVLSKLDLEVLRGSIISVVGRNGVGKTTLARIISGLELPSSGSVLRHCTKGKLFSSLAHQETDGALLPWRTNGRNIGLGLEASGASPHLALNQVSSFVAEYQLPIPLNTLTASSSGGQRQMVVVARAAVLVPEMLVLDEPFSRIDPTNVWSWRSFLLTYGTRTQSAVLIITHSLDDALYTSDEVLLLSRIHDNNGASFTKRFSINVSREARADWRRSSEYLHLRQEVADALDGAF